MRMPNQLSDMTIDEISLVDEGANGEARVVIFKAKADFKTCADCETPDKCARKRSCMGATNTDEDTNVLSKLLSRFGQTDPGGTPRNPDAAASAAAQLKEQDMDIEALSKALEDAEGKLVALEKRTTEAESALEDAQAVIKAKDDEITDLKQATKAQESDEDVMKSLPEVVRKRIEESEAKAKAAEEAVAKMQAATETQEAIAKAKTLGFGNAEEVGPMLLRVRKGLTTAADADALETMLKAQSEQGKVAHLFKAMGTTQAVDGDPELIIKAKADEIRAVNKGMTAEQAYAKAVEENPALYNAYVAKRRAA
jgi:predicted  nucleic acid-binding Zn-ribbon protein